MSIFSHTLKDIDTWFEEAAKKVTSIRHWQYLLPALCVALVHFVSFPDYNNLTLNGESTWNVVLKQIDDPTTQYYLDDPEHHNAKRTFRLTVPIIFRLAGISNILVIYLFQVLLWYCLYFLIVRLVAKTTNSPSLRILIPLSICFTYLGQVGVVDVFAKFDSVAIFFLFTAMITRNPILIFCSMSLAYFTDERSLLSGILIVLWWQFGKLDNSLTLNKRFFRPCIQSVTIVLATLFYIFIRFYLSDRYSFVEMTGDVGFQVLSRQLNMLLFGILSPFDGIWVLFILSLFILFKLRQYFILLILVLVFILSIIASFLVIDISRSLLYAFPLLVICYRYLNQKLTEFELKGVFSIILFINVLIPTYAAYGAFRIETDNPFFIRLVGLLLK